MNNTALVRRLIDEDDSVSYDDCVTAANIIRAYDALLAEHDSLRAGVADLVTLLADIDRQFSLQAGYYNHLGQATVSNETWKRIRAAIAKHKESSNE
jgi:hypothetical protein